ncbi:STAS domain-containing protein [Kineococcus aurantiacus]|uniref:Anti-anti-sigma factor n=1 Tax=Kineococcus aurantiacus TaxID=37633 RepID=A0A7Y9DN88_9ACTN|nr:STAS domain-containing protein [Kineococcus aurantiacus]NYD23727.1 anti-anti-sigma factor [Kineococcus aurantiacus]
MSTPFRAPDPQQGTPDGRVRLEPAAGRLLVRLTGEIDDELRFDLDDAAAQVARSREAGRTAVAVDAREVTFMDSAGAAFLARLAVAVRPDRITVHPSEPVAFLLDVTRLSDVVDVVADAAGDVAASTGDGTGGDGPAPS